MAKLIMLIVALAAMPALVAADGAFPFPSNTSSLTITATSSASASATVSPAPTRTGTKTIVVTPAPATPTPDAASSSSAAAETQAFSSSSSSAATAASSSSSGVVLITTTGTFVLSGSNWAAVLATTTLRAQLTTSLETDCSALFGGLTCRITSLTVGSLVVQYEVTSTTAIDVASVVATATASNSWLTNTAATYASSGATDSIGVSSFTAVSNTPTPATTSFAAPKATWAWWWMVFLLPWFMF